MFLFCFVKRSIICVCLQTSCVGYNIYMLLFFFTSYVKTTCSAKFRSIGHAHSNTHTHREREREMNEAAISQVLFSTYLPN